MVPRIGQGYDVHRLVEGRALVLGGVAVPWEKGLLGHSDADVVLHALMDALLGAAALGDIGQLFPDSDPAFEGADSLLLLRRVADVLSEHGYSVGNVDATVLGDIGRLFPDSDERYRGADSRALLREVARRLGEAGFTVGNVDVTLVAQRPKVAPYVPEMRRNIASDLGVALDAVSVKATTEEGLGFTGTGEGMAAQAVALIWKA